MVTRAGATRSRRRLDERLAHLGPADRYAIPRSGWIRAVRESLGMSLAELGMRLGVSPQSIMSLERSEQAGKIRLDTLRRAAEAMDCTLVYALLPKTSLEDTVRRQAFRVVESQSAAAMHSMALEAQPASLSESSKDALVAEVVASGRIWSQR